MASPSLDLIGIILELMAKAGPKAGKIAFKRFVPFPLTLPNSAKEALKARPKQDQDTDADDRRVMTVGQAIRDFQDAIAPDDVAGQIKNLEAFANSAIEMLIADNILNAGVPTIPEILAAKFAVAARAHALFQYRDRTTKDGKYRTRRD